MDGGAVAISGAANVFIDNCVFINNTAGRYGGAIYYSAGGLNLVNSYFYGNKANNLGGAVCIGSGSTGNSAITNSTFIYNGVAGLAGAIYANKPTTIDGSIFISNYASQAAVVGSASAIQNVIKNSIILNNTGSVATASQRLFWSSSSSGTFVLNYNWWGNNVTNKNTKLYDVTQVPTNGYIYWLYLDSETNVTGANYLLRNETVQFKFTLNKWASASTNGVYADANKLPTFTLNISSFGGNVSTNESKIIGGIGEPVLFYAGNEYGKVGIKADIASAFDYHTFQIIPDDSFSALYKAINEAPDGSILNLTHGYHYYPEYDSELNKFGILIKNLTINGYNTTIDAKDAHCRIFKTLPNSDVVINNITFINADFVTGESSIIYAEGYSLTINNCTFNNIGNHTSAIYIGKGDFVVNNTKFFNITTIGNGGAIRIFSGSSIIDNCLFENMSSGGIGAAIFSTRPIIINNTVFKNGTALLSSGAIYSTGSSLEIYNSNFTDNKVTSGNNGGAVYYSGETFIVDNSIFEENSITPGSSTEWSTRGGAIWASATTKLTVSNSNFTNNKVNTKIGKYSSGAMQLVGSAFTVTNCIFDGNEAPYGGVANIDVTGGKYDGCIFTNNYAYVRGSILNVGSLCTVTVVNSVILNNSAPSTVDDFRRIFSVADGSTITNLYLNYNWWGNNVTNKNSLTNVIPALPQRAQLTTWLYLDSEANVTKYNYLFRNETNVEVFFKLNQYYNSASGNVANYTNANLLPTLTLDLLPLSGKISSDKTVITKGIGDKFLFNASDVYGITGITASILGFRDTHYFMVVPDDSFAALQKLIDETPDGGVLNLTHGYHYYPEYDSALGIGVSITKSITINAINTTIDAKGYTRAFIINGNKFTLNNITIVNGKTALSGAAILHQSGHLTLNNVNIANCEVTTYYGGAIYSRGSGLTVYNSSFENLSCVIDGGVIGIVNGSLSVYNSNFINATGVSGGAIYMASLASHKIVNSNFYNITSTGHGGVIAQFKGNLLVNGSNFIDCRAGDIGNFKEGGAIYLNVTSGKTVIDRSNFTNIESGFGAGVCFRGNTLEVYNSYFSNNFAHGANGKAGGIGIGGAATNTSIITNCSFISNRVELSGAAIYANQKAIITGCLFLNNHAVTGGAVLASSGVQSSISYSIILNNTAETSNNALKQVLRESGSGNLFTLQYNWWGNNASNYNNLAAVIGAVPANSVCDRWLFLDIDSNLGTDLFLNESLPIKYFLNHYYLSGNNYTIDVSKLPSIIFNTKASSGNISNASAISNGVFDVSYVANEIDEVYITVYYSTASQTNKFRIIPSDSFSALQKLISECNETVLKLNHSYHYYPDWDSHLINGVKVNKNIVINAFNTTIDGKNMARIFEVTADNVIINNITFVNGLANRTGTAINAGAIYWTGASGILANSTFVNNTAVHTAGAIRWIGANGKLINSVFENNTALDSAGGAIYWEGINGLIDSSNFTNNSALTAGAIHVASNAASNTFTNSIFVKNHASDGGAICNNYESNIIKDSTFIDNDARRGGAIFTGKSSIKLTNLVLINNSASFGGAVFIQATNTNILSSVIMGNTATYGGAIYLNSTGLILQDSVIYGNIGQDRNIISASRTSGLGTLNYNWWGNNESNYKVAPKVASGFEILNWIYLTIDANESVIEVDQSEKIIITLNKLANEEGDIGSTHNLAVVNFTLSAIKGVLNKDSISMASGSNEVIYTAKEAGNNALLGKFYEYSFRFILPVFSVDSFTALNALIENSVNGIVNLTRNYKFYEKLDAEFVNGITVNKTITIIGNGHTIDGMSNSKIFNIEANNVSARNVTFANGTIYWNGANAKLDNITFNNSHVEIGINSNLNITNVKEITPKDNSTYVIINRGTIHLENNKFNNFIYNLGTITSPIVAIVLNNQTVAISPRVMDITAQVFDDDGNIIRDDRYVILVDDLTYEPRFNGGLYVASNYFVNFGNHTVTSNFTNALAYRNITYKNGLIVGEPKKNITANITVNVTGSGKVIIQANITPNELNGTISLYIGGEIYYLEFINGTGNFTVDKLPADEYNMIVYYPGDDLHNSYIANVNFTIELIPTQINITFTDYYVGDDVIVIVNLTNGTTGLPTIYVDNKKVTYTNLSSVNLGKLDYGVHTISVFYAGDKYYDSSVNITTFEVKKHNTTITVNVSDITTKLSEIITINVTNGTTGQVSVNINGTKYLLDLKNSKVNLTLNNLKAGTYTVNVTYLGDSKYNNSTFFTTFTVTKINSTLIVVTKDIIEGDVVVINVTTNDDASGIVLIKVNNTEYKVAIINGTAVLELYNVVSGNYSVNVTYDGDDVYANSSNSTKFTVTNKTISTIELDNVTYTVNTPTSVNVTTNFENGLIDVYVDGIKQTSITVADYKAIVNVKGLTAGNHTLMFVYAGNENFTALTVVKNITVSKFNSTVVVSAQDIETGNRITVDVNASGNGSATIVIFNSTKVLGTYSLLINNGIGSIIIPYIFNLTGTYNVNVTYNGDDVYLSSSNHTSFDVTAAIDYDFKVITNTALVGETAIVNVTLPGNANSDVILTLPNGTNLTVKAVNGVAVFTIDGLPYGNYTLNATYVGDNNYQRATKQGKLSILKHDALVNLTCDIKDFNATGQIIGSVTAGGKVNLTVQLPNDAAGNVTVYLNNHVIGENIAVDNGKVIVELKDYFTSGINIVNVTYTGDDKYYNSTVVNYIFASAYVTHLNVTVENNTYIVGSDVKLNISTNAQGNLTIYVNSHLIETITINGDTIYTLNNVTAGETLVMIVFHPNDNFTGVFNTTNFTVVKKNTTIGIDVVGSSASLPVTVIVTFDKNVTGWVNAYVNGTTPQSARSFISNNQVTFVFYGLEVGKHNVTIVYEGDNNYNSGNKTKIFTIDKSLYYPINVTVEDVYVGDDAYVIVTLPAGATGLINITLQGEHFTGILENATVNITIPSSVLTTEGKYNIIVAYNGSDEFNATTVASSFNVLKVSNYPIVINVTDIKYNELEIINITLPSDINNTIIKVLINGVEHNVTVVDGKASLSLNNLTVGSKSVKVVFSGNNRYSPLNATDKFVVSPNELQLNVTVDAGISNATINVIATPIINATVNVYVGGRNKTVTLVNGRGSAFFDALAAGNYTAIVIFDATENYTATSNKTSFTLNKQDFYIKIGVDKNILYNGDNNTVVITYTAVKSTDVNITINGHVLPLTITQDGANNIATISLSDLEEGHYDILVKYIGDEYNPANKTASFNVYKLSVVANETIHVWETAYVTVTLPTNASGLVKVIVDGNTFFKTIEDGVGIVEILYLDVGTHELTVSYIYDSYYPEFTVTRNVTVVPTSNYNIVIENPVNPEIGVDNNITVILPENATGNVAVYLDGKLLENASLVDGKAIISVLGNLLTDGNHSIRAIYYGDVNYTIGENNTDFIVSKQNISFNVTVVNVTVVDQAIVNITTNITGAECNVIINVAGTNYTAVIKNNIASVTLNNLAYGDYDVFVYFAGNNKYNAANATTRFNVAKLNTTIVTNASENIITVTLNNRTTGIVYVEFKGKNYTGIIYNGDATIVLPVDNGRFDLTVIYDGDEKFNANSTPVVVEMHNEGNYTINTTITNPIIATSNNITVILPANATGNVSVYLDGVLLTTAPLSGGKLVVPVNANLMTAGNHTIRTVYSGDANYIAGENTTSFTITKKALTIDLSVNNIKVGDVEVITVNIPQDAAGVVLLNVNGVTYYVNIVNGTGNINITKLTNGTYSVIAEYGEDDLYNASNTTKQFNVTKISDYNMDISYTDVVNNATKVTVTLPDDATGIVTIIVNGTNFTGVIYKGKSTIDVNNLIAPVYNYIAIWDGGDKYVNGSKTGIIYNNEFREKSQVIVSVDDILVGDAALIKINVTDGATGNVRITVNGKNIIVPLLNSSVTYKLTGLLNGTYDVNVTYLGDYIYGVSENSTTFKVSKHNSSITINVTEGKVGESITITITGPDDASGVVDVIINGTQYNAVMVNGKAVFNTTFDKCGQYNITANYAGNNKYNPSSNSTLFVINPLNSSIVVSVDDIKVGQNATIAVIGPGDATGVITILVDGNYYNATIVSGKTTFTISNLSNGTYNVTAFYNGDDKYRSTVNSTVFNVTKVDIVPDISSVMVDTQTNITVNVPVDATGSITIYVGSDTFNSPIISGIAFFNLNNIVNGTNVTFVYDGNDKYNGFNTSAIIYDSGIKVSSSLSIMISNIKVGENATITVGITDKATGNITINIGDKTLSKEIVDGKVTFIVSDLAYGTYNVTAVYAGDSKFLKSNITSSISVSKHDSNVFVSVVDIKVGENANITVFVVPLDVTGNVSIKINGIYQDSVIVSGGKAVFVIPNLGNGTYEVVATYNGDAKYLNSTGNATFKVSKVDINPNIESTSVLDNKTTVTVIVPSDAGGNITIIVGADEYIEQINDGKAIVNVSNVGDGTNITIVYDGDDKYNGFSRSAVVTDKGIRINPSITVVSDKSEYLAGETAVITITVPEDARGNVTIKVNGEIINITDVSQGMVVYNYAVISSGNFNVEVIYNGDNKYGKASNTTLFDASRVNSTVVIDVNSTTVGESIIIVVYVPDDAAGEVSIVVDAIPYGKLVDNGKVVFNLTALAKNNYTVVATFIPSDDKYNGNTNSTSFDVTAKSTILDVVVSPITYGEDANVVVTVPVNATGYVTITIGDNTYLANINNGTAKFSIPNLEPGVINLEIEYSGDDNYYANITNANITVNPKSTTIDVIAGDINKGETAVITVVVSKEVTGVVVITVGGKDYNATIDSGIASFTISGLDVGSYNIVAKYLGNKYYANTTNDTVSFNVLTDSSIITTVVTRAYGSDYDYEALFTDKTGKPLANVNVTFAVNGREYYAVTDENGIARLPGGTLSVGNHTVVAINLVTGYETHNTTEIKPRLVDNADIIMDFKDGSRCSVRVIGDDGKPVGAGVEIVIKVNTVNYKVKTNKNGYASLAINLNPGKYTISAAYKGFKVSNMLTVRQTLSAKKTQVAKKSAKVSKIKATLKWSSGKGINGKKVTMKFRGILYKAKTNSNGIATFKLPKKVIKNLKAGKTYKIRFTYLTNSIYKYIKIKK